MTEHRTERLATLFDRCLAAQRAGAPIDREQLLAEHPDLADDLRAGLDSLGVLGEVATLAGEPHEPRVLGDFRIVREIGRGGMGVVYEAEQLSLGRRVALKVLPFAAVLDQKQLQRFRNEAQAAAHLHHTSIVPVHAVGCERGVHYYAMQYIEGESLARAITELRREGGGHGGTPISSHASNREPAFLRMAARIGEQAAEALDHAHQMGVVHRDVKPGNLLVDAAGSLWVADFGLARFERAEAVTVTGDLVGTFRYMSPEQALGKRVPIDHRTDVYSLGATLYELVTLEPAVTGTDPQAVIQEIAFKDPRLPRRLNPAVPPDLETILMKAMAKDPAGRYATAQEMADDLRSFLADLPIRARRPTLSDRALKWARRHRTVVGAAVALLLLATAGMAVASVLIAKERDTAEERRKEAEGEREEARRQAALAEAVAAFLNDDLLGTIAQERTGLGATLREFLDAASERIGDRFASEPLVEARIRRTIAEAYEKLGLNEVAEPHLLRACELLAGVLGEAHPDTLRAQYALASSLDDQSRHKEAEALIRSVFERQREVLGDLHKHTLRSKYKLANTLRSLGRAREAEALLREVLETQRRLLGDDAHDTISSINSLASALEAQGRAAEAEPLIREAIEIQGRKGGKSARILGYMNNLANDLRAQGRHAEAEALHREVLEARRRVLDEEHPDTLETRRCLADDLAGQGRLAEAEAIYRDTLVSYERVRGEDHFQTLAAKSGLAAVLSGQGKHAEAEALARRVLDRGRLLRGDEAPRPWIRWWTSRSCSAPRAKGASRKRSCAPRWRSGSVRSARSALRPSPRWRASRAASRPRAGTRRPRRTSAGPSSCGDASTATRAITPRARPRGSPGRSRQRASSRRRARWSTGSWRLGGIPKWSRGFARSWRVSTRRRGTRSCATPCAL